MTKTLKPIITLKNGAIYDLSDPKDLRLIICQLTDGVYNSEDSASFTDSDIFLIDAVRNLSNRD